MLSYLLFGLALCWVAVLHISNLISVVRIFIKYRKTRSSVVDDDYGAANKMDSVVASPDCGSDLDGEPRGPNQRPRHGSVNDSRVDKSRKTEAGIRSEALAALDPPGVTVLRPLKGLDDNSYVNLESTLHLDYPRSETLFLVASPEDPIVEVVERVLENNPEKDARLIVAQAELGINPKVNNLAAGVDYSKYDILWVVDSNCYVPPSILRRDIRYFVDSPSGRSSLFEQALLRFTKVDSGHCSLEGRLDCEEMDQSRNKSYQNCEAPNSTLARQPTLRSVHQNRHTKPQGLVHHLPLACNALSTAAIVEAVFLNSTHARLYVTLNVLTDGCCVVGKSNIYHKSTLEASGGMKFYSQFLAEDAVMAASFHTMGFRNDLSDALVYQSLGNLTWRAFWSRRKRWIRVRKYTVPIATMFEPFTECFLLGLVFAFAVSWALGPGWHGGLAWLISTLLWFVEDAAIFYMLAPQYHRKTRRRRRVHNIDSVSPVQERRSRPVLHNGTEPTMRTKTCETPPPEAVDDRPGLLESVECRAGPSAYPHEHLNLSLPFHKFALGWLIREITALPLYIDAVRGWRINWRDQSYVIESAAAVAFPASLRKRSERTCSFASSERSHPRAEAEVVDEGYRCRR